MNTTVEVHGYTVEVEEVPDTIKDHLRDWVKALRDPAAKQARNRLRAGGGFCCLGVACDVWAKATGRGHWDSDYSIYRKIHYSFTTDTLDQKAYGLPAAVRSYFGTGEMGFQVSLKVKGGTMHPWLSSLNDDGIPFSTIADLIEARFRL